MLRKLCIAAVSLGLMTGLSACASGARPEAMTVLPSTVTAAQPGEVGHKGIKVLNVNGGEETNPLWIPAVSTQDFRIALEESLRATQYLGSATDAPLSLTASLMNLKQPMAGASLSVVSTVRYQVKDDAGQMVFDEVVSETGTAGMFEAYAFNTRLRLANEYSIRNNIKSFIERFRAKTED